MIVSIEVPVIKGGWLMQCIDSVLQQTSPNWQLSLYWDQGDVLSESMLRELKKVNSPKIQVFFGQQRLGIARARQLLTQNSSGDLILPLDDDDVLLPQAVERFLLEAAKQPWAGIVRAKREFIDHEGELVMMDDWFDFKPRSYFNGATCDINNHSQPYVIRRDLFISKGGWTGFSDFEYLGEDCGCFTKMEEIAEVELLDVVLYQYRLNQNRTSLRFDEVAANEMWRRIADEAIQRRKLPVQRINDSTPFIYSIVKQSDPKPEDVDVVIPFWETNEREVEYTYSRPVGISSLYLLKVDTNFAQNFNSEIPGFNRLEIAISTIGATDGFISVALFSSHFAFSPTIVLKTRIQTAGQLEFEFINIKDAVDLWGDGGFKKIQITFEPCYNSSHNSIFLHVVKEGDSTKALLRFFETAKNHSRAQLERCISSALANGINKNAIHVIEKQQSSSKNRNEAFKSCSLPWVCFMDDDAEVKNTTTIKTMLDSMTKLKASLCGPKLITPSGKIYSGIPNTDPISLSTIVAGMGDIDNGQFDLNILVPWLPSTVLIVNSSVMHSTGGFDESFEGSQHEDVDFCFRARARGFKCCYAGQSSSIHHNMLRNGHFSRNMEYLNARWQNRKDLYLWSNDDFERKKKISGVI